MHGTTVKNTLGFYLSIIDTHTVYICGKYSNKRMQVFWYIWDIFFKSRLISMYVFCIRRTTYHAKGILMPSQFPFRPCTNGKPLSLPSYTCVHVAVCMYGILLSSVCTLSTNTAYFPQTYISPTYFPLVGRFHPFFWATKALRESRGIALP